VFDAHRRNYDFVKLARAMIKNFDRDDRTFRSDSTPAENEWRESARANTE